MKRLRSFLRVFSGPVPYARIVLSVAGLVGIGAGALIAWRAVAATPLLVVAAVLAAFGLFDWTELTAKWGDSSVTMKRAKEEIERIAEREDVSEPAREELRATAKAIDLAVPETSWTSLGRSLVPRHDLKVDYVGGTLVARFSPRVVYGGPQPLLSCAVTTPDTQVFHSQDVAWGAVAFRYPDDFADAPTVSAGTYHFQWYQRFAWEDVLHEAGAIEYRVP